MDYKLVKSYVERAFVSLINDYLKEGWEPQGGVQMVKADSKVYNFIFVQALIKKSK